jgi:hypothetical protein
VNGESHMLIWQGLAWVAGFAGRARSHVGAVSGAVGASATALTAENSAFLPLL